MHILKTKVLASVVCRLIWAGFCVGLILSAHSHPSTNEMPFVGLMVLPEANVRLMGRNQADYEIGKINSLDRAQVEHSFTVRNEGETPLAITDLEADCHCTAATVEKISGQELVSTDMTVFYLLPGQEMVILLSVQLARQISGPMSHGVTIYASGYKSAIARLHITGEVELGLMVNPAELDFGQMKLGETQSRTITITCDQRLLSGEALPRLEAECVAALGTKTGMTIKIVPQAETASASSGKSVSAIRVKTYLVSVQPNQKGELNAHLFFRLISPEEYKGIIPYDRAVAVFREMSIEVHGVVTKE